MNLDTSKYVAIVVGAPDSGVPSRYHALDSLRAVMMLSGIYLHVVVAYATVGGWPYKQGQLISSLNWSLGLIHIFRMPIFYVMAGFFGALLYSRRGLRGFLDNRVKRVLLPFIGAWLILFPMVIGMVTFHRFGPAVTAKFLLSREVFRYLHPMHLWFLEYLILLYAFAILAVLIVPASIARIVNSVYHRIIASYWAPLAFAVPSFLALLPMHYAGLEDPPGFSPVPRIVIAYVVPFTMGWLLYEHRGYLDRIRRTAWVNIAVAAIAVCLYLGVIHIPLSSRASFYADRAMHSLALWFLIFGVTGLFLRYLDGHSQKMRYVSDASYFLYLAHMPVIIALQFALEPLRWNALFKIPIVLTVATAILFVLYHYLVRPTAIGAALNGRRYPIGRQAKIAAAAAA